MQMKVSTLKAKSALFDVNKIKGSENKILTATKDIRKDYDSSRGFGLATLTAITTYKDPKQGFKSRDEFESLLYEALAHGASDIFISPDRPITMMKDLELYSLTHRIINRDEALHILRTIADENAYLVLINNRFINKAYRILQKDASGKETRYNFRVNVSRTSYRGSGDSFQITLRTISGIPPHFSKVGLDEDFIKRSLPHNGCYIIGGITGSGKSTTLASNIRYVLENNTHIRGNILTHNEPIEYEYDAIESTHSIVSQSEIPNNFETFADANREAMRRRPAAVEIGELRDKETISAALELSLTGHPVFATVHATTVDKIIPRMLKRFKHEEHLQAAADIIGSVYTLIAQRLVKDVNGKVFAVREHLILSPQLKEELLLIDDIHAQQKFIRELMINSDGSDPNISKSFRKQADDLLKAGRLHEDYYYKLIY